MCIRDRYKLPADLRPEAGLLAIRKGLGLFANMRPAYLYEELKDACPLREDTVSYTHLIQIRIQKNHLQINQKQGFLLLEC